MIVRTSAKSRLMTAGSVTRVGDALHALAQDVVGDLESLPTIEVCWSSTSSRRSLGTTIRVSTSAASSSIPLLAWVPRRLPSKVNGLVTMPTVRAPTSRARRATTGRGAATGAAACTGGDEDHVGALEQALDLVLLLEGRAVAHLGVGAGAKAARLLVADVHGDVGDAELQGLKIGVDRHELDPGDASVDHAVDRVDAGTADADDFDHRLVRLAAARRLVGRLFAPVARVAHGRFLVALVARLRFLGEDPLQALRRGLGGRSWSGEGRGSRLRLGPQAEQAPRRQAPRGQ